MDTEEHKNISDTALIDAYLSGDGQAFEILYYRYNKMLYGYLNNLLKGSGIDTDDIFEETWLKVISKLPKYRDEGRFSAWLFRMGHNLFIDQIRKNKNRQSCSIDQENVPELPAPEYSQPGSDLENMELGKEIRSAIDTLSTEQKEVFLLRQQEFSFKEIADIQKCSLNTVLSRMHYAVKNLRNILSSSRSLIK